MEETNYNRPPELIYNKAGTTLTLYQMVPGFIQTARRDTYSLLFAAKFIFECDCGSDPSII
jgi:hypothetical protein